MMFEASIVPSAEPAPTMVCNSSMNRMMFLARRISSMTALMRSSNWPRYFVPATMSARSSVMTRLSRSSSGTLPVGDFLRQAFDDGRLAHAGFAEQHRIVLRAAAENLDDALDFILAADDRVHLAFAGDFRQVAAKGLERGRLDFALLLRRPASRRLRRAALPPAGEIRVQFLQNFLAGLLDVHVEVLENARGHAVAFAQQAEQDVLGADVGVIEGLGLLLRQGQDLLHARRVGNVADHLLIGAGADLLLDFHADGFEVEAHFLEDIDGDALAQFDQAEQKMFGADESCG